MQSWSKIVKQHVVFPVWSESESCEWRSKYFAYYDAQNKLCRHTIWKFLLGVGKSDGVLIYLKKVPGYNNWR